MFVAIGKSMLAENGAFDSCKEILCFLLPHIFTKDTPTSISPETKTQYG